MDASGLVLYRKFIKGICWGDNCFFSAGVFAAAILSTALVANFSSIYHFCLPCYFIILGTRNTAAAMLFVTPAL